jgi:hypothetical protein
MKEDFKRKNTQRILIIISGLFFVGSTGFGLFSLFNSSSPSQPSVSQANDQTQKLTTQEKGFEEVLKREPNSQFALQGLFDTRLAMYRLQGDKKYLAKALEPLDKLIKLYPKEEGLKLLKAEVEKQLAVPENAKKNTDSPNSK